MWYVLGFIIWYLLGVAGCSFLIYSDLKDGVDITVEVVVQVFFISFFGLIVFAYSICIFVKKYWDKFWYKHCDKVLIKAK